MATRKGSPKQRLSEAQLAYAAVTKAFMDSFDSYSKGIRKHKPNSRFWLRTFISEWQKEIEWRTAQHYGTRRKREGGAGEARA